jgi:hypothetical protein
MRPSQRQAAHRRSAAVNHWGRLGQWDVLPCRNPQQLSTELASLMTDHTLRSSNPAGASRRVTATP